MTHRFPNRKNALGISLRAFFLEKRKSLPKFKFPHKKNRKAMYYNTYIKNKENNSESIKKAPKFINEVYEFLRRPLQALEQRLDKRYVYTAYDLFMGILSFRDRINGLLLSELGGYIAHPSNAPAGTKRISNLLRNEDWSKEDISEELFLQTKDRLTDPQQAGKWWLMLWDDSVIEKPESWFSEGLCAVKSSKAARLTKIKKGFYTPPQNHRICVPGHEWSAAILTSRVDKPMVCSMEWWTTRGNYKEDRGNIFYTMLKKVAELVNELKVSVWNVLDRGYASLTTLERMYKCEQKFIIRWKSNQLLADIKGEIKNTYKYSLGQKNMSAKMVWDKERNQKRKVSILYRKVKHPELPDKQLYLIIVRDKRRKPMYLLTNVEVNTVGMAWEIFFSYMQRWDIEQSFRFGKTAMAMESPRLWFWENRLKLLMIVTLVIAFLLNLLYKARDYATELIKTWCPRTGKRQNNAALPLYRLRLAVSQLILYELIPK